MLLDDYMPAYDVTEVHSIRIKASPETAYQALNEITLVEISGIVRLLLWLRALPEKPEVKKALQSDNSKPFLNPHAQDGFVFLSEEPAVEFVFGLIVPGDIGRFWKKDTLKYISFKDAEGFMAFKNPDYIRVVANFSISPADTSGWLILRTESRSVGLSKKAFKSFNPY